MSQSQQEKNARQLYGELVDTLPGADISIEGGGVHWRCETKWGNNTCRVHCFAGMKVEYLIKFERYNERIASGRTSSRKIAVSSVKEWLRGMSLERMYLSFEFIDQRKRQLEKLRDEMVTSQPELEMQTLIEMETKYDDEFYTLALSASDRTCHFFFYGYNDFPDGYFSWDETQLFKVVASESIATALAVKLWLCDFAMPSLIEKECPWIKTGKLARLYEQGRKIEGEFIVSWDDIEEFYKIHFSHSQPAFVPHVVSMIVQLRQLGFDKTLRAGQSMSTFIVSRSRRHGLRQDQPSIAFNFGKDFMIVDIDLPDVRQRVRYFTIALTDEIIGLLRKLETQEID